jgi:hypothetical protein
MAQPWFIHARSFMSNATHTEFLYGKIIRTQRTQVEIQGQPRFLRRGSNSNQPMQPTLACKVSVTQFVRKSGITVLLCPIHSWQSKTLYIDSYIHSQL